MKTKHIFTSVVAAMFAAACTNEDFVDSNNSLSGNMMDASNFTLVAKGLDSSDDPNTRVSLYPQYVTEGMVAKTIQPIWETGDMIGFSHIYTDQEIITNYKFTIKDGIGGYDKATFKTDNSTIFEGDYFVYYPYNPDYAAKGGIPFALDAIQEQDASVVVKVGMDPTDGVNDVADLEALKKAGEHLARFSISSRVTAEAQITQQDFALKQYTTYLAFLIYPKNQTQKVNVKRIEMVAANDGQTLDIPTKVLFKAKADVAEPQPEFVTDGNVDKMILLFNNVDDTKGAGGLELEPTAKPESASLAYMSMLPNTYAKGTYKFVVYYTENSILKKKEIAGYKDLNLKSNAPVFFNVELDANGAIEVTDYDIYTETEFASAVIKSNKITNGEVTFNIKRPITLTHDYTLESSVPVTFNGGQKVTLGEVSPGTGAQLVFNSNAKIIFNNVIGDSDAANTWGILVKKGEVEIKGVDSEQLNLGIGAGKVTIMNADGVGILHNVTNQGTLTLADVNVKGAFENKDLGASYGLLTLTDATVAGSFTNNTSNTGVNSLENVSVTGNFTNTKGTLNITGTNNLAYNASTVPVTINSFNNNSVINFSDTETNVGNLTNNNGTINLANKADEDTAELTAKGTTDLTYGLINVESKGTYNAEGALSGLKGDGTIANSTMILEGKLTTAGVVTLSGNFSICGIIENKAGGSWTLYKDTENYGVYKFSHSHVTEPKFKNYGEVIVQQVTNKDATAAMNAMAKDLYEGQEGSRLEWYQIEDLTKLNEIVGMGDNCWATDLATYTNISTGDVSDDFRTTTLNDWSAKNVIVEVRAGTSTANSYTLELGNKQIKAKKLNIEVYSQNPGVAKFVTIYSGSAKAFVITETLSLINGNTNSGNNEIDLKSASCKDIVADNKATNNATLTIKNGYYINYTNTYSTFGDKENTAYPNNIPQKITD